MEKGEWHKTSDLYFLRNQCFPTADRMEGNRNGCRWYRWALETLDIYENNFLIPLCFFSDTFNIHYFLLHFNTTAFPQLYYKFSWVTSPTLHRYNPSDNFQTCIPSPDVWKPELHFPPFIRHIHLCNALRPKQKTRARPHKSGIS